MYVLGLMTGTSADAVDAALVEFTGHLNKPSWKLLNFASVHYSEELQKKIIAVGQGLKLSSSEWLSLSEMITDVHLRAAKKCDPNSIAQIAGCHGQTVFHRPPEGFSLGGSLQLIQAPFLATRLDMPVVYDFRSKDLSLGGQGAPLSSFFDFASIGRGTGWRAVLNLGGIANITIIPPRDGPDRYSELLAWDCGPANTLIDLAVQKFSFGQSRFDHDGLIAMEGIPDEEVISRWLKEDYFQASPPKSTGRESFGEKDLERRLSSIDSDNPNDVLATLTAFSACVIAQDIENLYKKKRIRPIELYVGGGGGNNPVLMKEISSRCRGIRVMSTKEVGIPSQAREAMAFAFLAWWKNHNKSILNAITGARRPSVLGVTVMPD